MLPACLRYSAHRASVSACRRAVGQVSLLQASRKRAAQVEQQGASAGSRVQKESCPAVEAAAVFFHELRVLHTTGSAALPLANPSHRPPPLIKMTAAAEALGYLGGAILSICVLPQVGPPGLAGRGSHRRRPALLRQQHCARCCTALPGCLHGASSARADLQDLQDQVCHRHLAAVDRAVHQRPGLHLCLPGARERHGSLDPNDGGDRRWGLQAPGWQPAGG
jgi:hypothetical protein